MSTSTILFRKLAYEYSAIVLILSRVEEQSLTR